MILHKLTSPVVSLVHSSGARVLSYTAQPSNSNVGQRVFTVNSGALATQVGQENLSRSKSNENEHILDESTEPDSVPELQNKQTKTVAEADEELRRKMSGLAGDGGEAGLEVEDGQPVSMKRSVKNNMFRYI